MEGSARWKRRVEGERVEPSANEDASEADSYSQECKRERDILACAFEARPARAVARVDMGWTADETAERNLVEAGQLCW